MGIKENDKYDIIIIGGGVIGCMVARFLSRYELRILLIEKESDIGSVTSAANTAIVHPGYDAIPDSLKAKLNVTANPMWDQLAAELQFAFERHGDYVVAIGKEELPKLDELLERGKKMACRACAGSAVKKCASANPTSIPL
jgi:glycerol-3-phosphate dehydrogenase